MGNILFISIIMSIITGALMIQVIKIIVGIKWRWLRFKLYRIITFGPIAFLINFSISTGILSFTGSGMTAGAANMLSSILVAVIIPIIADRKFGEQLHYKGLKPSKA
jgi:hypothetical protein